MNDFVVKNSIQLGGSAKGNTGTVTGNATLDLSTGDAFEVVPTADVTFAFSNPPAAGNAKSFSVALTGADVGSSYDLANASYDSVSFNVSTQEASPIAMTFNNNGTKMYVCGFLTDAALQYSLSTAYDISTATYDSVSVSSIQNNPAGLSFNGDGTKFFINSGNIIDQYTLTSAYDLSTASYDSVNYTLSGATKYGLVFGSDGLKMFVVDLNDSVIQQYNLSSAFDVSTASPSVTFNTSSQDNTAYSLAFNSDGTKLYVAGLQNDSVYQYSLSNPYTINTATYDSVSFSVASQTTSPAGIAFNTTGTKMYIVGNNTSSVLQYTTATAPTPTTITYPSSVVWSGGTAPTTPADGVTDLLTFYTEDGGNTYYGFKVGEDMA